METIVFAASALFAVYWTVEWFRHRNLSIGHFVQIICALMLWGVVLYFYFSPEVSRFHMLWAMPFAFFSSSFVSAPTVRWYTEVLRKKHGLD
jgi:hypothetical protein